MQAYTSAAKQLARDTVQRPVAGSKNYRLAVLHFSEF